MATYGIAYEVVRAGTPPRLVGMAKGGGGSGDGEFQVHSHAGQSPPSFANRFLLPLPPPLSAQQQQLPTPLPSSQPSPQSPPPLPTSQHCRHFIVLSEPVMPLPAVRPGGYSNYDRSSSSSSNSSSYYGSDSSSSNYDDDYQPGDCDDGDYNTGAASSLSSTASMSPSGGGMQPAKTGGYQEQLRRRRWQHLLPVSTHRQRAAKCALCSGHLSGDTQGPACLPCGHSEWHWECLIRFMACADLTLAPRVCPRCSTAVSDLAVAG